MSEVSDIAGATSSVRVRTLELIASQHLYEVSPPRVINTTLTSPVPIL